MAACSGEKVDSEDTGSTDNIDTSTDTGSEDTADVDTGSEDTGSEDTNSEDTGSEDTGDVEPEPFVVAEGSWSLGTPNLLSDPCGLNGYEDVTSFVPAALEISNSDETGFNLDAQTRCALTEMDFTCDEQQA